MKIKYFPFSGILGNDDIKLGLIINSIDPKIGGLLITGPKGIGKSTIVRSLSRILPEMDSIKGCKFSCTLDSENLCDDCSEKVKNINYEIIKKNVNVITLPISSTLDRVVGSLDISSSLSGKIKLNEGLLGESNNGILYIDEVNLLDDSISDSILDSSSSGINIIERDGISYIHPARFILVGTMNPEEGELRPQLLDRFGISGEGKMPDNPEDLMEISRRIEEFDNNPDEFIKKYKKSDEKIEKDIIEAKSILKEVRISNEIMMFISKIVLKYKLSNRAMISAVKAAKAIAAYNKRKNVTMEDGKKGLEFSIRHRINENDKKEMEDDLKNNNENRNEDNKNSGNGENGNNNDSQNNENWNNNEIENEDNKNSGNGENWNNNENINNINVDFKLRKKYRSKTTGKNSISNNFRYLDKKNGTHLDMYSSLVNMKINNRDKIDKSDLVLRNTKSRGAIPIIIGIDSSTSMGFNKRIKNSMYISELLLKKSYLLRSMVALISFSENDSKVLMNFSRNFPKLNQKLKSLKSGGKTPLSSGLNLMYKLSLYSKERTLSFLFTDGRGNVSISGNNKMDIIKYSSLLGKYSDVYIINEENGFLPTFNDKIIEYSKGKMINDVKNIKID